MALYSDPDEVWALAVGRFVVAFGDIEHTAIRCLEKIPREALPSDAAGIPLTRRLKRLREALIPLEEASACQLLHVVGALQDFVVSRNLIAHNGIRLAGHIEDDGMSETVTLRLRSMLISAKDPALRVTLDDLRRSADDVEELAWRFTTSAAAAFAELSWVDYDP